MQEKSIWIIQVRGFIMANKLASVLILILMFLNVLSVYLGISIGQKKAYDSIILEECWLNKESRDIECIKYILED